MEEKEQSILVMRDLCKYTGEAFTPYLAEASEEVWRILDFPDEDLRKTAVEASAEFIAAYYRRNDAASMEVGNYFTLLLTPKVTIHRKFFSP